VGTGVGRNAKLSTPSRNNPQIPLRPLRVPGKAPNLPGVLQNQKGRGSNNEVEQAAAAASVITASDFPVSDVISIRTCVVVPTALLKRNKVPSCAAHLT
jgi:hypothetical protein